MCPTGIGAKLYETGSKQEITENYAMQSSQNIARGAGYEQHGCYPPSLNVPEKCNDSLKQITKVISG